MRTEWDPKTLLTSSFCSNRITIKMQGNKVVQMLIVSLWMETTIVIIIIIIMNQLNEITKGCYKGREISHYPSRSDILEVE